MLEPKELTCRDCGIQFQFEQGQADYFNKLGFDKYPTRCSQCSAKKKAERNATKQMFDAVCAKEGCGVAFQVPFNPEGKTVYCREHFVRK